jgi:transglutaminase-like putative cysteine protease
VIFEVSHRTIYDYAQTVSISLHLLHLLPRQCPHQSCGETALEVTPAPSVRHEGRDYFGNPINFVTIQQGHRRLVLHALSFIDVTVPVVPEPGATPPWEEVAARLASDRSAETLEALEHRFASPYTPIEPELEAYARASFTERRPLLEAARDLTRRIFEDFKYDSGSTSVGTPIGEAFRNRHGVCQDFAHIEIACLRALGLAARYVSGYLLTRPPEGKEKLVGSDASHAWVSLWVPAHGWVDLDPTNDLIPKDEHVTLAWGRDYGDVSPVQGVMFGGSEHRVSVAVDVTPLESGLFPVARRPAAPG